MLYHGYPPTFPINHNYHNLSKLVSTVFRCVIISTVGAPSIPPLRDFQSLPSTYSTTVRHPSQAALFGVSAVLYLSWITSPTPLCLLVKKCDVETLVGRFGKRGPDPPFALSHLSFFTSAHDCGGLLQEE